jgi:hypothetical protein
MAIAGASVVRAVAITLCEFSRVIAEIKETLRTIGSLIDASKRNFADLSQQVSHR